MSCNWGRALGPGRVPLPAKVNALTMSSLDPRKRRSLPSGTMEKFRAAITAIVALALASLPVPAAAMHASMITAMIDGAMTGAMTDVMSDAAGAEVDENCCPQAENCDKHTQKDCDHSGACALKCSALSANVVAGLDLPPLATPSLALVVLTERLCATKAHPLLPPPRV